MRAYAEAILHLAHSRHIGATAELIAALVPLILSPKAECADTNPWASSLARLKEELSHHRGKHAGGLLLSAHPAWCVLKLALPLLSKANRVLGQCYLYCEEHVNTGVEPEHLQTYTQKLARVLNKLPQSEHMPSIFWKDRALTLSAFSKPGSVELAQLPEADGDALALLLRVATDPDEETRQQRQLKQVISRTRQKQTLRAREGGFDGIHLTRRPEDLDGILLSEFINPDFLLTDRLLNTGYFSLQRAPRRQHLKDVYVAGVMPGALTNTLVGDFVKACWFDAVARLGHRLRQAGLTASAFSWIQGDHRDHLYRSNFQLDKLPHFQQMGDGPMGESWRREFLSALGWVPRFFTPTDRGKSIPVDGAESPVKQALHWSSAAWKYCATQTEGETKDAAGFSILHVMIFLPADTTDEDMPTLAQLQGQMGMSQKRGRHVSVTRVPKSFADHIQWAFAASGRPKKPLMGYSETAHDEQSVARTLVNAWLDQFSKEIWRG